MPRIASGAPDSAKRDGVTDEEPLLELEPEDVEEPDARCALEEEVAVEPFRRSALRYRYSSEFNTKSV